MDIVAGQGEVVDGDVATVGKEAEGDGTADTCSAAGDGGGLVGEEMERHCTWMLVVSRRRAGGGKKAGGGVLREGREWMVDDIAVRRERF